MADPGLVQDLVYSGADLHRAADKSHLRRAFHERVRGVRNAAAVLSDLAPRLLSRGDGPGFELVVATGKAFDTEGTATVAYAGHGTNRAWCLSTVLANCATEERLVASQPNDLQRRLEELRNKVDILFVEGMPRGFRAACGLSFASMPAWVKQRVRVLGDWPGQIDALRRITRQETGRILRKYRYRCTLTRSLVHYTDFYEHLYRPYVTQRFGATAHVVEPQAFLKECSRGSLLRVTRNDVVVGASLLRPVGRTMAVVWSALNPARDVGELRGLNDALDYFSLLYAHLQGCRWLDLGPSRPDLFDGILRYKSKWGGEIHGGLVPQSTLHWTCLRRNEGTLAFLQRHAFLLRARGGLRAVFVIDGGRDPDAKAARLSSAINPGIRDYRVVTLSPVENRMVAALRRVGANLTVVTASSPADIMAAITGSGECASGPAPAARSMAP